MEYIEIVIWSVFLCIFSIWFTVLSKKLSDSLEDIGITDQKIDDIEASVIVVAELLQQLPQLMPQFHMNNNPLAPIIEKIMSQWSGGEPSLTESSLRGPDGRFTDGTRTETQIIPKEGQSD